MAEDVTGQVTDLQTIEVGINGPGRARRLFIVSGQMPANLFVNANTNQNQQGRKTVVAKIGPELTSEQFVRAAASAAVTQWQFNGTPLSVQWSVDEVDADYDDESGHVAVEVETSATVITGNNVNAASVSLLRVGFTAQIVATE